MGLDSTFMEPLKPGAEASPYLDREQGVVYKLFDLLKDGSMGKIARWVRHEDGRSDIAYASADMLDMLKKLCLLNICGALPTEIVGLSRSGTHLIVKQPQAAPVPGQKAGTPVLFKNQRAAVAALKGHFPEFTSCSRSVGLLWIDEEEWLITDLHEDNIMLDDRGAPSVIDAILVQVPPEIRGRERWLDQGLTAAECLRKGKPVPEDPFDSFDDDEL